MPLLNTSLQMFATLERESFQLALVTASGNSSNAVSVSRTDPFFVAVTLFGWNSADGSVILTGRLAGVTVSTTTVFTGNVRRLELNQQFDEIVSVATTGFTAGDPALLGDLLGFVLGGSEVDSGSVRVDAVSRSGQPDEKLTVIGLNIPCRVTRARLGSLQQSVGDASIDSARIFFFPDQSLFKQDRISVDGDRWQIKGVQPAFRLLDGQPYYKVAIVHSEDQS